MFFTLSKIIAPLIAPLNIVFLLLFIGSLLLAFKRKAGRSFLILGMIVFIGTGLFPLGHNALAYLEHFYDRPADLSVDIDGILILGGASQSEIADKRGVLALNDSAERIIEALSLSQKYPEAIIVFAGGNGQLIKTHERTEADDTAMLVSDLGIASDNIFYEDTSRTTFENILFTRRLFFPQPEENWLLVTSAFHMPRAMAVAQRQNWMNLIPYPVDYRTIGGASWLPTHLDVIDNMADLHIALHEFVGLAGYQLTGRISLPLH